MICQHNRDGNGGVDMTDGHWWKMEWVDVDKQWERMYQIVNVPWAAANEMQTELNERIDSVKQPMDGIKETREPQDNDGIVEWSDEGWKSD